MAIRGTQIVQYKMYGPSLQCTIFMTSLLGLLGCLVLPQQILRYNYRGQFIGLQRYSGPCSH